uniref:Partner of NOB1 homolog n=1 Tax=Chelonoidis abingdonii TaxID=106734 RepID=A0A8C0G7W0_CHEAB
MLTAGRWGHLKQSEDRFVLPHGKGPGWADSAQAWRVPRRCYSNQPSRSRGGVSRRSRTVLGPAGTTGTENSSPGGGRGTGLSPAETQTRSRRDGKDEMRKIPVPAHRYTPLKENWMKIFTPIVEHLQLQIRFNLKTRNVEIKVRRKLFPGIFMQHLSQLSQKTYLLYLFVAQKLVNYLDPSY